VSEAKKQVDWERVELDYRAGLLSTREIGATHGVSHTAVHKRAKSQFWRRESRPSSQPTPVLSSVPEPRAGFVYVIYLDAPGERFFKIGMATVFGARFDQHQCSSPYDVRVACAYFCADMRAEERALHERFSLQRVRGEWFQLCEADLQSIAARSLLL
jgi:hypothetical protein